MRSILIITLVIALSVGYLYWSTHQNEITNTAPEISNQVPVDKTKVINSEMARLNRIIESREAKTAKLPKSQISKTKVRRTPLDLSIPSSVGGAMNVSFPQTRHSLNWRDLTDKKKEEIEYDAELVFDEKEGSTVTGGKVHVKIPFG